MRLVEVVMLMGAHCVSPVEHSQMMTDAAKVRCAVVIEKDTDRGIMTVTPGEAASDPQVMAAIERFRTAPVDPLTSGGTKIVPAWAPAGSPPVEVKLPPTATAAASPPATVPPPIAPPADEPAAADAVSDAAPPATAATADAPPPARAAKPAPETKVATLVPPPQKRAAVTKAPARQQTARQQPANATAPAPKSSGQCKGDAVPKWYKAADGHRKYRCVKPTGDAAPDQLY
ncbi:MAG: hypothetical protein U1E16_11590 [Hyphomicrobiales bacterium]